MLSELERRMLGSGRFYLDGWDSLEKHNAASRLVKRGYLTCYEGGSSQYTSLNFTLTEAGKRALAKAEERE